MGIAEKARKPRRLKKAYIAIPVVQALLVELVAEDYLRELVNVAGDPEP